MHKHIRRSIRIPSCACACEYFVSTQMRFNVMSIDQHICIHMNENGLELYMYDSCGQPNSWTAFSAIDRLH